MFVLLDCLLISIYAIVQPFPPLICRSASYCIVALAQGVFSGAQSKDWKWATQHQRLQAERIQQMIEMVSRDAASNRNISSMDGEL